MKEYIIEHMPKSCCPLCKQKVKWLAPKEEVQAEDPTFFICFACCFVGQVGVGVVPEIK